MNAETLTVPPNDMAMEKIKKGEKIAYALGVTAYPLLGLISGFLMIFYTDVVGLNIVDLGTLFLIARVVDGFSDPLMGYMIDHFPRTRMGKYRPVFIMGSIICSLNYILVWFGPVWAPTGKLVIAYLTYLLLGFTFDLMDISKNSLLPAMTADQKERNSLGTINAFTFLMTTMLLSIAAPLVLAAGHSSLRSYYILILITAGAVIPLSLISALGVKERVKPVQEESKHSIKDYLLTFAQRPVLFYLIFNIMFTTATAVSSGIAVYFFTYVLKNLAMMSMISLSQVAGLIPGIFLSAFFVSKVGKKKLWVVAALAMAGALMIRWIDPTSVVLIYISTVLGGFILGAFLPTGMTLVADNIDYIEYKLNYRSEASQSSIMSAITKFGNGVGGAIPAFALGWAGYIAGSQQQPVSATNAMILLTVGIPVIFFIIAAVLFGLGYNLDKKRLEEIETTLSERRAAAKLFVVK